MKAKHKLPWIPPAFQIVNLPKGIKPGVYRTRIGETTLTRRRWPGDRRRWQAVVRAKVRITAKAH